MQRVFKVTRFHMRDSRNALVIFYLIVAAVLALFMHISQSQNARMSGLGLASLIFIFIAGLDCFSTAFRFMQANNVSRRYFFFGTSLSLFMIAALMASVDAAMNVGLRQLFVYKGLFQQLYPVGSPLVDFCWSLSLFAFAAHLGWLITMVYYRSNPLMRTLVSVSPVLVIMLFLNISLGRNLAPRIIHWFAKMLGLMGTPRPFVAIGSFLLATLLAAAGSWLLLRRATVRG
ncbi:MAG: hypothetical protein ACOX2K_09300 [Bacillota bacterium]|jgi:hypothetical protein